MNNNVKVITVLTIAVTVINMAAIAAVLWVTRAQDPDAGLPDCEPRTHRDQVQIGCRQPSKEST